MDEYRIEHDSLGEVRVPADALWGAQTERSRQNFKIGQERMPMAVVRALVVLKKACAGVNGRMGKLNVETAALISQACDAILAGGYEAHFPLVVWQTGSGTQSNMNANEVIAHLCARLDPEAKVHPNDHVNRSQSSNDTFPTAMHIAAVTELQERLFPSLEALVATLRRLEVENWDQIKIGRTHLQDAVPLRFGQELSGWRVMLERAAAMLQESSAGLRDLAIGGTAVGTGLNAPEGFGEAVAEELSALTGHYFNSAPNKFHALTSQDALVYAHGALKALAANLMKIANDVRWMASGPNCGLGEISIPENEPGSSIMPGKVNPTQCEALTMAAVQVMGNDAAIGIAASQGNFELNVYQPVAIYNFLQSTRLLADAMASFNTNCAAGIRANSAKMEEHLRNSVMLVTALTPSIGYDKAAKVAQKAQKERTTLKEACLSLGFLSAEEYDRIVDPAKMV